MNIVEVPGTDHGEVFLYALSTCVWCKKTKALLNELGVAYRYVDVDLVPAAEQGEVLAQVARWNPQRNFPTLVIKQARTIVGFKPDEIKEALER